MKGSATKRTGRPPRILLVITDLDIGGAEKCLTELAMALHRRRWAVAVCCLSKAGPLVQPLRQAGVAVYPLGAGELWSAPRTLLGLTRLIRRLRPDLVHTFLFHANIAGRLAGRLAGVQRIISSVRVAERRYRWHLIAENLTCRLSRRVVCVSRAVARFTAACAHVPVSRLCVIANGATVPPPAESASRPRSPLGLPPEALIAICVARLEPQKGVDVLIRALPAVLHRHATFHLLVAGVGRQQPEYQSLAAALGVASHVHWLGLRCDVPDLLRLSHLFVLPSRWEGMPNAVLEAMAAGLPVVATRVEGTEELVRDGQTGRLVPVDDPTALANAIIEVAGDADKRHRWGQAGRQTVRHHYSLARMVAQYEALYRSL